jgi:hypothetical protein
MRPFPAICPNHENRPGSPIWALFCLSPARFSDATEPRPFWYGCQKLSRSMGYGSGEGGAGSKGARSGGVTWDQTVYHVCVSAFQSIPEIPRRAARRPVQTPAVRHPPSAVKRRASLAPRYRALPIFTRLNSAWRAIARNRVTVGSPAQLIPHRIRLLEAIEHRNPENIRRGVGRDADPRSRPHGDR